MKYQFSSNDDLIKFLNNELLSTTEAAEILDVSKARIGHMVNQGKLKLVKEQPKIFLKSMILERKKEQEDLRKKYRPYD
jgi:predicted DNA-binding protein YlxM (UPF0122 family)